MDRAARPLSSMRRDRNRFALLVIAARLGPSRCVAEQDACRGPALVDGAAQEHHVVTRKRDSGGAGGSGGPSWVRGAPARAAGDRRATGSVGGGLRAARTAAAHGGAGTGGAAGRGARAWLRSAARPAAAAPVAPNGEWVRHRGRVAHRWRRGPAARGSGHVAVRVRRERRRRRLIRRVSRGVRARHGPTPDSVRCSPDSAAQSASTT